MTVSAPRVRAARDHGLGLLARGHRVHAARGQARRVQVGAQPVRVVEDAERFHRAVSEGGDPLQDPCAVGGQLFADGVELQSRGVSSHGVPFSKTHSLPPDHAKFRYGNQVNSDFVDHGRY